MTQNNPKRAVGVVLSSQMRRVGVPVETKRTGRGQTVNAAKFTIGRVTKGGQSGGPATA